MTEAGVAEEESALPSPRELRRRGVGGAAHRTRRTGGSLRRLAMWAAAFLSVTVLVVCTVGYGLMTFYDHRIRRTSIASPDVETSRPPPTAHGQENWLLVGSDVRTGSDAAAVGGARSDSMLIAHLGSDGSSTVVSIPRDLYVTIPTWTDQDGHRHATHQAKINSAFNAGPALLVATLEQLADIRIDHYAEIDFRGFKDMSTALGGVTVCLNASDYVEGYQQDNGRWVRSTNLNDPNSGFHGRAGENVLTDDQALAFVRQRHGLVDGDLSRIKRQQTFLGSVFRQVTQSGVLLNPAKLASFLNAVTASVLLDENTGIANLRTLADRLKGMSAGRVVFTTIPIAGQIDHPEFRFTYDPAQVRAFFQQIAAEGPTATPSPAAPSPAAGDGAAALSPAPSAGRDALGASTGPTATVPPSQLQVTVRNGSGVAGLARTVAASLQAAGFGVDGIANSTDGRHDRTEVHYAADSATAAVAARTLLAAVPGARAVADPTLPDGRFTLILGSDLGTGDTVIAATPTAGESAAAASPSSPTVPTSTPLYTQPPVSAAAGCIF
jgi:LCP family protein required for cell wall assembly